MGQEDQSIDGEIVLGFSGDVLIDTILGNGKVVVESSSGGIYNRKTVDGANIEASYIELNAGKGVGKMLTHIYLFKGCTLNQGNR